MKSTRIEWADHSWSPWRGCQKVSRGCSNCYAETLSKRNPAVLGVWGPSGTRVIAKDWSKPLAWDRAAAKAGERRRIFPSLCDWLEDRPELDEPRARLLALINATPNLDWLLLTKRPESFAPLMERIVNASANGGEWIAAAWAEGEPPPSVWLGVSAEDQETADARIPALLEIPAALRWASYEPALGPVDFSRWIDLNAIDWIVVGGESGPRARPFDLQWARDTIRQCREAGVPVFVKQLGRRPFQVERKVVGKLWPSPDKLVQRVKAPVCLRDPKGGDPSEWPPELRVREMPRGGGR